jgi:hypothetical protein
MRVKNWAKFQHFKDRRPPWIKLYRDILDDPEWHELDPMAAKVLTMLWLIASEQNGELPDIKKLAFRLRLSEDKTKQALTKLSHWMERDDIGAISERYRGDAPETEGETEREKELETDYMLTHVDAASRIPDCPAEKIVEIYHRELPANPRLAILHKTRRGYLKQRWAELYQSGDFKTEAEGLEVFATYFQNVKQSKFLTGQTNGRDGKPPFIADLEWLVKPTNFAKVVEGKYT